MPKTNTTGSLNNNPNGNAILNSAKYSSDNTDEWYTTYETIAEEVSHYEDQFYGKTVLCNCDDPYESNFCYYFLRNFNRLRLKKLICTSYADSKIDQIHGNIQLTLDMFYSDGSPVLVGQGYVLVVSKMPGKVGEEVDDETIKRVLAKKNIVRRLKGDGDFRSAECVEYLKQADVVVTNPPFSIAREHFVPLLFKYNKSFLIVGDLNWVTYKGIFPLLKENKMWFGYNTVKKFIQPDGTIKTYGNKLWFTNLDIKKRHEELVLFKQYTPEEYPRYDNFDAIEVSKVTNIPMDYDGIMGVPITFMDKYNPKQFEIVDFCDADSPLRLPKSYNDWIGYKQNGEKTGRTGSTFGCCPVLVKDDHKTLYYEKDGVRIQTVYMRIFIRRKEDKS